MSGAEILAIAASVVQIADAGARLSVKLYTFTRKAKGAEQSVQDITQEIAATGAALRELGEALGEDKYANISSRQFIESTSQIVADCWKVFEDINDTIGGGVLIKGSRAGDEGEAFQLTTIRQPSFTFKQRLRYPFIEPQIDLLRAKLQSLKSSLILMLQVFSIAEQVRNRPQAAISEDAKALIEILLRERSEHEKQFERLANALECSQKAEQSTPLPAFASVDRSIDDAPISENVTAEVAVLTQDPTGHSHVNQFLKNFAVNTARVFAKSKAVQPNAALRPARIESIPSAANKNKAKNARFPSFKSDVFPTSIRVHREEMKHHAQLVTDLLHQISDVQYRVSHEIRDRMQTGVLRLHWDEWAVLANRYGHDTFIGALSDHDLLARYWTDQVENRKYASPQDKTSSGVQSESLKLDLSAAAHQRYGISSKPTQQHEPQSHEIPSSSPSLSYRQGHVNPHIGKTFVPLPMPLPKDYKDPTIDREPEREGRRARRRSVETIHGPPPEDKNAYPRVKSPSPRQDSPRRSSGIYFIEDSPAVRQDYDKSDKPTYPPSQDRVQDIVDGLNTRLDKERLEQLETEKAVLKTKAEQQEFRAELEQMRRQSPLEERMRNEENREKQPKEEQQAARDRESSNPCRPARKMVVIQPVRSAESVRYSSDHACEAMRCARADLYSNRAPRLRSGSSTIEQKTGSDKVKVADLLSQWTDLSRKEIKSAGL